MKPIFTNQSNKTTTPIELAEKYHREGEAARKEAKPKEALIFFEKANMLLMKEGKEKEVLRADTLHQMSDCYLAQNNHQKAIAHNQEALNIQMELLGEKADATLNSRILRGVIWERMAKYELALEDLLKVQKIYADAISTVSEYYAILHWTIGSCYDHLSDPWQSILYYQKATEVFEKLEDVDDLWKPLIFNALGLSYSKVKNAKQALYYFLRALDKFLEKVGKFHPLTTMIYTNIGLEYYRTSRFHQATPYFQKSVEILEHLDANSYPMVDTYVMTGANYSQIGKFEQAQEYLQKGLKLSLEIFGATHPKTSHAYYMLAFMYEQKGDYLLALKVCQEGLRTAVPSFGEESIYPNPSLKDTPIGNYMYISLLRRKSVIFQYYYLQDVSKVKNLETALNTIDLAIQAMERIDYHTEHSKLLAEKLYSEVYEISMQTNYLAWKRNQSAKALEAAFTVTEKAKASLLRFSMQDKAAKIKSPIPRKLVQQEQVCKVKLTELDKALQTQKASREDSPLKEAKIQALYVEFLTYQQQYSRLMEQLSRDYPDYYQLKYQNQAASISQIQELLQLGELLIEYSLYEESLFVFAIDKQSVSFKKVTRSEDLEKTIDAFCKRMLMSDIEEYARLASALYHELLQPIEATLEDKNKLLIIPDGILHRLPFDALISPLETPIEQFSELPYLIKTFDIQYHYSATLLWHSHQKKESKNSYSKKNFLGLAPIKFGQTESSNTGYILKSGKDGKKDRKLILKSGGNEQEALMDLEETETEVKTVYELFEKQEKEAVALFYDMASKENLLTHIEDYKYVLLSTHGFSNTQHSTLSGLNLYTDNKIEGSDSEAHKLYISDIMNLQLSADLVVLSSCESGVGKLQKGEGMMGLHRAFLYAGVQNIVYSLFKVRQDSTRLLVEAMFRFILAGDSYAAALRKAKIALIEDELMEPVDWAGFALIGTS